MRKVPQTSSPQPENIEKNARKSSPQPENIENKECEIYLQPENITQYLRFQRAAGECYSRLLIAAAERCGLTKSEADVLVFLANNPAMDTARDIARYRGFSKPYISTAVEGLLAKGLINVAIDQKDRRYQHLTPTEASAPTIAALREAQAEFPYHLCRGASKSEMDYFFEILDRLSDNMTGRI